MPQRFGIKLHRENSSLRPSGHAWGYIPWTCSAPLIGRAKENALNNPPCPITPTLTSSSDYNVFIVLQCHLQRQFVPKSDVKQWFTTTTTTTTCKCKVLDNSSSTGQTLWTLKLTVEKIKDVDTSLFFRGTGMIASSSTFRPHPRGPLGICFVCLDAVYGIVRKH